jgi:hypothetical protein
VPNAIGLGISLSLAGRAAAGGGAAAVVFVTTNGTRKHANITLSGGNLTEVGNAGDGASQLVSADTIKAGKRYFEATVIGPTVAAGQVFGIDAGGTDLSADIAVPGTTVTSGCVLRFGGSGTYQIHVNGGNTGGGAGSVAANDVIGVEFDTAAQTCSFYKNGTQIDVTQTGVSVGSGAYAIVGGEIDTKRTANFGASAFGRALSSGYSAYQT